VVPYPKSQTMEGVRTRQVSELRRGSPDAPEADAAAVVGEPRKGTESAVANQGGVSFVTRIQGYFFWPSAIDL
jgi:1,6-anhydro-N-acetylmuramate kinase